MDYIKIRFIENAEAIESEFHRTVEEMLYAARPRFTLSRQQWRPQIDIYETRDEIVVIAELAGVEQGAIDLEIGTRAVKISGARSGGPRNQEARYRLAEIPYGRFERDLTLPVPIETDTARAFFRDGLLEIRLAKRPPERVHRIDIQHS